jgi:hypothetical protein
MNADEVDERKCIEPGREILRPLPSLIFCTPQSGVPEIAFAVI